MANTNRRKRHRILALFAAGAVGVVVVLIVAIVAVLLRRPDSPPTAVPPTAVPPTGVPPTPSKPRPEFQDASCPDVQLISIPGTWESSVVLDPFNPVQFPAALLLNVTNPIRGQFDGQRLEVFTVPYTAQFHNPLSADRQMSYNDSRAEGTRAAVTAMT
ncbi:cutinase, partial [Mycobacterium sp. ITM-2017-0098]